MSEGEYPKRTVSNSNARKQGRYRHHRRRHRRPSPRPNRGQTRLPRRLIRTRPASTRRLRAQLRHDLAHRPSAGRDPPTRPQITPNLARPRAQSRFLVGGHRFTPSSLRRRRIRNINRIRRPGPGPRLRCPTARRGRRTRSQSSRTGEKSQRRSLERQRSLCRPPASHCRLARLSRTRIQRQPPLLDPRAPRRPTEDRHPE